MSILYLTNDLMFSSRMQQAGERTATSVKVVGTGVALREALSSATIQTVVLDLSLPSLDLAETVAAVRNIASTAKIIAYGPHVHNEKLAAAQTAGCDVVLSKGQFHSQMDALVRGQSLDSG